MREKLEDLKSGLRNLGYEKKETRWGDYRTLEELNELTRGISESLDTELQKLNTMWDEIQKNTRFTRFSGLVEDMIRIKSAEREEWEEILNVLNFLSY